jgi:putative ABC transport system permease protein
MNSVINLNIYQMIFGYIFIMAIFACIRFKNIRRGKQVAIASTRMTLQLILTGFLLQYIIKNPNPFATISIIILMESFAIHTLFQKFGERLSKPLKKVVAISLISGSLTALLYFLLIVIQIKPWYLPQYFIPIAGMIVGNGMNGVALAINSMLEAMAIQKSRIEEALVLGATPKAATEHILKAAFDAAIMPTLNTMLGMGIIFLPGMMTGQILSGTNPLTAITYQIIIMLGILAAASLSVFLALQLGYKTFFNKDEQLV